jgi:hypothetical protein
MPTASEILVRLGEAAQGAMVVAIGWHLILAAALAGLVMGWRPSQRVAAHLLAAPCATVALVAVAYGNPFNAIMFAGLAIAQTVLARRSSSRPVRRGAVPFVAIAVVLIAIGWTYPHFLAHESDWMYLYSAPVGVLPCPTLYVVIGLALLGAGVGSRLGNTVLVAAGLGYGVIGLGQLHVWLDAGLIVGALALAVLAWRGASDRPRDPAR